MQYPPQAPRVRRPMRSVTVEMEHWRRIMPETAKGLPARVPPPKHRHAAPSGPWPFLDLNHHIDSEQLVDKEPVPTRRCDHSVPNECNRCWSGYPQSLFPNWTNEQQSRSRILRTIHQTEPCTVHYVDVDMRGEFATSKSLTIGSSGEDNHWELMTQPRPEGTRLRALFLENLSGPVLQMLGTKYNIEPFYFSSSIGWIPSRYQEEIRPSQGDHITISLTFIRTMDSPIIFPPSPNSSSSFIGSSVGGVQAQQPEHVIDTQSALFIRSANRILLPDLLSLHMVRSHMNSTIISYHPSEEHRPSTAPSLHSRLNATGHSVYWSTMFAQYDDPTFILLSLLWYALYAWDEALEVLYTHICFVESRVLKTNDIELTQELHVLHAHLLHYTSLLEDFRKTVVFIRDTPYPGLDNPALYTPERRDRSNMLLHKECTNLLNEIERLEMAREMQSKRLRNVMNLSFSSVNIEDSRHMQQLTEATVKDSAAMKQVAYLTMFFLPSSLVAGIFGMNVGEINPGTNETIPHFIAIAISLTILTFWGIGAIQFYPENDQLDEETSLVYQILRRLGWPVILIMDRLSKKKELVESRASN